LGLLALAGYVVVDSAGLWGLSQVGFAAVVYGLAALTMLYATGGLAGWRDTRAVR
jgi:hypothetical protein